MDNNRRYSVALLTIPSFIILIAALYVLDPDAVFEPPNLLFLLNTVFLGIIPLYIAFVAFRTFRKSRSLPLILLGAGMLVMGVCSIGAGWTVNLTDGPNITVTIHNTAFLAGALLSLLASIGNIDARILGDRPARAGDAVVLYAGTAAFAVLLIAAAAAGILPPFVAAGGGFTLLRQAVLTGAILLFTIAAFHFYAAAPFPHGSFFRWYALALGLIAIGLGAVLLQPSVGSAIGWAGRIAQYLGACFALVAMLSARRAAAKEGVAVEDLLALLFSGAEEGYRNLITTAADAIVVFDPGGRIILWNPAAERLFGYERADAVGRRFSDLVLQRSGAEALNDDVVRSATEGFNPFDRIPIETEVLRKDGGRVPAELTLSHHSVGGVRMTTCVIRDISRWKKDEEAVRESEEKYRSLFENLTSGALLIEPVMDKGGRLADLRYLMANPAVEKHLGKTPDELIGRLYSEVFSYQQRNPVFEKYENVLSTGEPFRGEVLLPAINRYMDMAVFRPVPGRLALVFSDISDRRSAEEAASAAREMLGIALNAAKAGTWVWDIPTGIVTWSPEFFGLFGLSKDAPASFETWLSVLLPEDRELAIARIDQSLKDHSTLWNEYRIVLPDESIRWIGASGNTEYDGDGRALRMSGICLDITERRDAEEALREAQERTAAVIAQIADGFYSLDREWRFTTINPAAQRAPFNRPAAGLLGRVIWDLYPQLKIPEIYRHYIAALEKQALELYEVKSPLNGRWYEVFVQGRGGGVDVYIRDIDDRKKAEEALKESEQKFRLILDNSLDALYRRDLKADRFEYYSPVIEEITGFSLQEISAMSAGTVLGYVHPDDLPRVTAEKMELSEENMQGTVDYRFRRRDGTYVWLSDKFRIITDAQGAPVAREGILRDITEQKRTEDALRESEEKYRTTLESISDGFFACDGDWRLVYVNAQAEQILGIRREAVLGKSYWEVFPFTVGTNLEREYKRAAAGEVRDFENFYEPWQRWFHYRCFPREGGGMSVYFDDITERKKAEEALKASNEELAERERKLSIALAEKEALLSEVHHRVKNNLASFISLLALDGSYDKTPAGIAMRNDLQNRARSMSLIHDTLYRTHTFSTVDMQYYLTNLVQQVVGSYRLDRDIGYTIDTHGNTLDLLRATPVGLIVNELVTNSLKYAFPKGPGDSDTCPPCMIDVGLERMDGMYQLTVHDNGVGLPAGFNPKAPKTLGLKLVNFLAGHQLRGTVAFTSGDGVLCRITFPENP